MDQIDTLLVQARQALTEREFQIATQRLRQLSQAAERGSIALTPEQRQWVGRCLWILSPVWSEPVRHGAITLRRCRREDEAFFRATSEDQAFVQRFNRQQPWSGDLGRALHKFGSDPPALLKMLQWVVCLRDAPVGLISLSHLDLGNSRAEFSIGFPQDMSAGVSHKACLLALHFAFFVTGLNKLYGYVYEGNEPALTAALRIGFREEGFLVDHFRFPPSGFVGVHVVGLTRQQAMGNLRLSNTVRRRIGQDWTAPQNPKTSVAAGLDSVSSATHDLRG